MRCLNTRSLCMGDEMSKIKILLFLSLTVLYCVLLDQTRLRGGSRSPKHLPFQHPQMFHLILSPCPTVPVTLCLGRYPLFLVQQRKWSNIRLCDLNAFRSVPLTAVTANIKRQSLAQSSRRGRSSSCTHTSLIGLLYCLLRTSLTTIAPTSCRFLHLHILTRLLIPKACLTNLSLKDLKLYSYIPYI